MDVYQRLAIELLELDDHILYSSSISGDFGFEYMADYSGLMAQPPKMGRDKGKVKRPKQGYFDIRVITGDRYQGHVTHRQILEDLLENSNESNCLQVWRGSDPRDLDVDDDELEALMVTALLMFEQEVNWGTEGWQRGSNYNPYQTDPSRRRPRDMFMGYIRMAFDHGRDRLDELKYWMRARPGTLWQKNPDEGIRFYNEYPEEYMRFFSELENIDGANALMVGEFRVLFREVANTAPNNPNYR